MTIGVMPLVAGAIIAKLFFHWLEWEIISLNPLFSGVVGATVFLLGFLIAGTLADYKESERLPGDIAASLNAIMDECGVLYQYKGVREAQPAIAYIGELADGIKQWLHKHVSTHDVMDKIAGLNRHFLAIEPFTQPNFIVRLKQEQAAIRRMVIRIDTIRETTFVSSGYAIAEAATAFLVGGLLFTRLEPFYESLFFVGFIAFLLTYMVALIKDLDNPFNYHGNGYEEVSLQPLDELSHRVRDQLGGGESSCLEYPPSG